MALFQNKSYISSPHFSALCRTETAGLASLYRMVTVTARRFCAQACSSDPNADGRSLP
jgi:hypothetical protein